MGIIVEGAHKVVLAGSASVVDDSREFAWAEKHVTKQEDMKFVLGNFVEADRANSNGHIFPLEDLQTAVHTIPHKPLNMIHIPHRIVGTMMAAELVYPTGESAADGEEAHPIVEALAGYWHYYFPEQWPAIQMAHNEGSLFFSMESVPEKITCRGKGTFEGCGETFEYAGRTSDGYCAHLNEVASRKTLHRPHFTASALILPPVRPGWKHADITELSHLIEQNLEEAEKAYEQVSEAAPHLDAKSWERIVAVLLSRSN
jgi:hypothetical protein